MARLMILALAVTSTLLRIECEELSADFDMSIDTSQSVNLGFDLKDSVLEPECEGQKPAAWCPKVEQSEVKFPALPETKKTFTFKGDRIFKIAVKKQIPATELSTVKFGCDIGHNVEQEVNAGFEITNGAQMCPDAVNPNDVITCKIDKADKKKVIFGGTCKAKKVFTFTDHDGNVKKNDLNVEFFTVDTTKPIATTPASTVTTATSTTIKAVKTTTSEESDASSHTDIEKEATTTSLSTTCKSKTIILAIFFIFGLEF